MAHNVDLGNLDAVVNRLIESGRYESESAVLRAGLRLLDKRENDLAQLHAELKKGLADIEAGRVRPAEEVFADLKARYSTSADERNR